MPPPLLHAVVCKPAAAAASQECFTHLTLLSGGVPLDSQQTVLLLLLLLAVHVHLFQP